MTARANDNTVSAGTRVGDTLRINLVAMMARWAPEADSGPFLDVAAFAEEGSAPQVPGPLIRVTMGTTIRTTVRNTLNDTLLVVGLNGTSDTLRVAPAAINSTSSLVRTPGSFAYYAHTLKGGKIQRHGPGEQLFGALIVDSAGSVPDRVLVLKSWNEPPSGTRFVIAVNGKSWPFTERITLDVGDIMRARVINGSESNHPMHLHGFYYDVTARGTWHSDTVLAPADQRFVVTETLQETQTMSMRWAPTRPGNWLFHCHDAFHIDGDQHSYIAGLDSAPPPSTHDAAHHAQRDMAGLVLGIVVRGEPSFSAPSATDRKVQLQVQTTVHRFGRDSTTYAYALAVPNADARGAVPGPLLELRRGERTAITVVNGLPEPTAVHWHGIELESYYDGVAGWSGSAARLAPLIMPRDSFVVVMTPPRAGTFIYHAHADDERQIALGLAGPLVVLEPGAKRDTTRDHIWLFSIVGVRDSVPVVVNATRPLSPLRAGVEHRIRIINITPGDLLALELHDADGLVRWRPIAKDGADLPRSQATTRPARVQLGAGETWDFVWTPRRGNYQLKVDTFNKFTVAVEARE
ncbi:MAG: multicopper oxidase domain-containing protein [Gemmatimonadaceae bacterium]